LPCIGCDDFIFFYIQTSTTLCLYKSFVLPFTCGYRHKHSARIRGVFIVYLQKKCILKGVHLYVRLFINYFTSCCIDYGDLKWNTITQNNNLLKLVLLNIKKIDGSLYLYIYIYLSSLCIRRNVHDGIVDCTTKLRIFGAAFFSD